jgi:hypothetical protein
MDALRSHEGQILATMLQAQGAQLGKMQETLERVGEAIETLARVEERLITVEKRSDDHETRLRAVEVDMPPLKEIRSWIVGAVVAVGGLIGSGVVAIIAKVWPK